VRTLLALPAAGLLFLSACAGNNLTIESAAGRLEIVAQAATEIVIANDPDERWKFEKAAVLLGEIEKSNKISVDSVVAALQAAGIDQLDSDRGRVLIASGRLIFYDYINASSSSIDKNLLPIVVALRRGIEAGL
jgi:hypothetical protein